MRAENQQSEDVRQLSSAFSLYLILSSLLILQKHSRGVLRFQEKEKESPSFLPV